MLSAVIPLDKQAWFFKAVGTREQMEQIGPRLLEFYESLSVSEQNDVTWALPDGWQEAAGNEMREATITVPVADDTVEISVSKLPWTGDGPGGLLANVNRWRGQMGLPLIGPPGLADCTSPLELGAHRGTLVDLTGTFSAAGMTAPFAATGRGRGPVQASAAHPPLAAQEIALEPPSGWQPLPAGGFRKAAFAVANDVGQAVVTVMDFPRGATAMADPLANVNRWRGELGLDAVTGEELEELTESVDIDGHAGSLFYLRANTDAELPEATLAAMVEKEDKVWFFKMRGDEALVAGQMDHFRAFLDSVRFRPAREGEDGDD
jgi:hypothetical protein